MKKTVLIIVRRLLLVLGAIALVWSIISINMADILVERVARGDPEALDQAITWDAYHPQVLSLQAGRLIESGQAAQAEPFLAASVMANPADARPLILLADSRRQAGDIARADKMAETAGKLMPVDAKTQRLIASYWYERGSLDLAVPHLSTALVSEPSYRDELFPVFLSIAETPGAREALEPITEDPPAWWDGFAEYAIRTTDNIDSLRVLAAMRKDSETAPITDRERNAYISRLKKDGLLAEAYMLWVNSLDQEQRQSLAYLYNGGFEQDFSNAGFGWYTSVPRNSGIVISTAITYGTVGDRALYLSFRGKRIRFSHLRQSLYLNAGTYRFSGRVRPEQLRARKGLQWVVSCTEGGTGELGQSAIFLGAGDWRTFDFSIEVPPGCEGQRLMLRSVGNRDVDHEVKGEIWFDDLRIQLQRDVAEASSGDDEAPKAATTTE